MDTMTTTSESNGTTTKAGKYRPIRLACPHCGNLPDSGDDGLFFDLNTGRVSCPSCSAEVTRADLDAVMIAARRLLTFLDMAATI